MKEVRSSSWALAIGFGSVAPALLVDAIDLDYLEEELIDQTRIAAVRSELIEAERLDFRSEEVDAMAAKHCRTLPEIGVAHESLSLRAAREFATGLALCRKHLRR